MEPKKEIYNDAWFLYKKYLNGDGSDEYKPHHRKA